MITIRDKQYRRKKLCVLSTHLKGASYTKAKENIVFNHGLIAVRPRVGDFKLYASGTSRNMPSTVVYNTGSDSPELILWDESLDASWEQLFIYFFDEDGSILLYADRNLLEEVGVRVTSSNSNFTDEIRQEALTVAALADKRIYNEIISLEHDSRTASLPLLIEGGADVDS